MSLSGVYGEADDAVSEDLIRHAIDIGVDHFDSSDMYGWGHNEQVLGRALKGRRDGIVVATKFGQTQRPGQSNGVNGRPEYVAEACEASLKRLGIDVIDLYYQHRVDPDVPVEETVGAMAKLVAQGKVRFLGMSEAAPDRIRRAHAVHPIAAVQTEYSLLYREEAEANPQDHDRTRDQLCRLRAAGPRLPDRRDQELSPISMAAAPRIRASRSRISTRTARLVAKIEAVAAEKCCTPAQVTLAWLLAQGPDVVAIPGTRYAARLDENVGALNVNLSAEDVARISAAVPAGRRGRNPLSGGRHGRGVHLKRSPAPVIPDDS